MPSTLQAARAGGAPTASSAQRVRAVAAVAAVAYTLVVVVAAVALGLSSASAPRSNIRYSGGTYRVHAVAPGDLLDRAGVAAGDEIVALDGWPFPDTFDLWDRLSEVTPGDRVTFTVVRHGARLELGVRTWRHARPSEVARVLVPVAALVLLGAAVFALRSRLPASFLLLLFCLSSAVNDVVQLAPVAGSSPVHRLLTFAYCVTSLVSAAFLLHLSLVFPHRGRVQRLLTPALPLAYAIPLGLGLDYWLPTVAPATAAVLASPAVHQWLTGLFSASVVACYALATVSLLATVATAAEQRVRSQAAILVAGFALLGLLYLTVWSLPIWLAGRPLVDPATWCLVDLVVPVCVATAIVSQRLFDINVLVRHGLVFAGASGVAVAAFIVTVGLAAWATETVWSEVRAAVVAVAAATAAFLFQPAVRGARELVDRTLYHRRYQYRQALTGASARLAGVVDLGAAAALLHAQLGETLQPAWIEVALARVGAPVFDLYDARGEVSAILEGEAARRLKEAVEELTAPAPPAVADRGRGRTPALVVPLRRGEALLGAILLGERPGEAPYLPEDRDYLATLASLAASAAEVARLLEERAVRERLALLGSAAGSMVHELKNPLGAMRSTLAVLRRRLGGDPRAVELTRIVEAEVDRLKERVMNVLTFVRPGAPRVQPVALAELLRQLAVVVEPEFQAVGVEVRVSAAPGATTVLGDGDRLSQAFLNLLLNAREAMPEGGLVEVSLEPSVDGEGQGAVTVTVADSGPGFTPATLARAFEPFFTTKTLGTGLGLANVRRVVDEHHGSVEAGQRPGGGAVVRVVLPEAGPRRRAEGAGHDDGR